MTTTQYIIFTVNNEFQSDYQRDLIKAYLLKTLVRNEKTFEPLSNHEIGMMLEIHRMKVGDYLFHMRVYNSKDVKNNPMFNDSFNLKFQAVKRACENYAALQMIRFGEMANNRAVVHLKRAKGNINYNLN